MHKRRTHYTCTALHLLHIYIVSRTTFLPSQPSDHGLYRSSQSVLEEKQYLYLSDPIPSLTQGEALIPSCNIFRPVLTVFTSISVMSNPSGGTPGMGNNFSGGTPGMGNNPSGGTPGMGNNYSGGTPGMGNNPSGGTPGM